MTPAIPTTKPKQRRYLDWIIERLGWQRPPPPYEIREALIVLREELHNRPRVEPAAAPTSVPVTPELQSRIRAVHEAAPNLPQQDIAYICGTNIGRVNEALRGKRI